MSAPDDPDRPASALLAPDAQANPSLRRVGAMRSFQAAEVDDMPTIQLSHSGAEPAAADPTSRAAGASSGSLLSYRYMLEEEIARGSCTVVFRARNLAALPARGLTGQVVAIKLLCTEQPRSPRARARLQREFQQLHRLSHPGIVRVFELDCEADACYMSMEFIAGQTVKRWMQTPRDLKDVLKLIESCCTALAYAHSVGIVHGDLKPSNIMVTEEGAPKLIDFGSAVSASNDGAAGFDPGITATLLYASPQILAGKSAEARDDVFSLACLTYVILTAGRHPFGGHPSLENGRAKSAPTYVPAIPPKVFEVLERALSAEPERRPASVLEFQHALVAAGVEAPRAARWDRSGSTRHARALPQVAKDSLLATVSESSRTGGRSSSRPAWLSGSLIILMIASAGATLGLRAALPRPMARTAVLPSSLPAPPAQQSARQIALTAAVPEPKVPAHDSGFVSFEAPRVKASAAQSLVAITVKRSRAINNSGPFVWRLERGSAYAGVAYELGKPQLAKFIEGQAVRTLFIPLLDTGASNMAGRAARSFTVVLEPTTGGPALGRFARVTVTIDPRPASTPGRVFQARADEMETSSHNLAGPRRR